MATASILNAIFTAARRYSCRMDTGAFRWRGYAWAIGACAACTAVGLAMSVRFDVLNIAMIYLLAVVLVALRYSTGAAILASVLCMLAFNYFFTSPRFTFRIDDSQYLLAFAVILAVGLIVSGLTSAAREQARRQSELAAEAETERMRSALLASISHDLRTPLAVLTGASSTLAERGEQMSAEERKSLSESLYRQATNLSEHVAKVLQMTRLESGGVHIERDWAAIAEIVESALRRIAAQLANHHVLVDIPEDLPLVRVDASLFEQAIVNLLENAARHTPAGTVVRVQASSTPTHIELSVGDFGPGMPEADLEHVFEKFHRRAGSHTGVGLGLAICSAIVRLHGGRVSAERNADRGMTFRMSIGTEAPPTPPTEGEAE
jgi:two-component system, OmpR family, sensor histidine kinase KdpD